LYYGVGYGTHFSDRQVRFDYHRVEKLLNAALLELLKGRKYVAADCKWLAQDRCDMCLSVRERISGTSGCRTASGWRRTCPLTFWNESRTTSATPACDDTSSSRLDWRRR